MPTESVPPKYAWKRRLDQVLEEPGTPKLPPFDIMVRMLPTILRQRSAIRRARRLGREPIDEVFSALNPGPVLGVPLGGLGGGTITRGWRGEFNRFQLRPGWYQYHTIPANQFSLFVQRGNDRGQARVLYPGRAEGGFAGWNWDLNPKKAVYHALYPRAWTVYEDAAPGVTVTCRQVSPFVPGNYQDSALPAGVFVYTIQNTGKTPATVGLMFTWQNGFGYLGPYGKTIGEDDNDRRGGHHNEPFRQQAEGGEIVGVLLHHKHRQRGWPGEDQDIEDAHIYEDPLTFAIAAQARPGVEVTYRTRFVANSSGMDVWGDFREDGKLENTEDTRPSHEGATIGAAVAATVEVPAGQSREVAFVLAWDMPLARFGAGTGWYRRYTRTYGREGNAAPLIARDALVSYPRWEQAIDAWQQPILDQTALPDWYKAALFNELYYLTDGGTLWTDGPPILPHRELDEDDEDEQADEPPPEADAGDPEWGHFGYLEGHEYRMVNTYDVHFYASFALAMLFPELQKSLQRDFARWVPREEDEIVKFAGTGKEDIRKAKGVVPHDLGGPAEDPWIRANAYYFQNPNAWLDLNCNFVLQVYRDYVVTQDKQFLADLWPAVCEALSTVEETDYDGDGLIENDGEDTTFDAWAMHGPSAYCGGLWLAALSAGAVSADIVGDVGQAQKYRDLLHRGQAAYEEALWNGEYYDFDSSGGRQAGVIMAAQVVGPWYARACGLDPVIPPDHAKSALETIYRYNVQQFEEGEMGAVNGMYPDGAVDTSTLQSQEVWPGVTYAVAAAMLNAGLYEEAWQTAKGIATMTYRDLGLWFGTPEAWNSSGDYRSFAYMRPLAIWAMQWAWQSSGHEQPTTTRKSARKHTDEADAQQPARAETHSRRRTAQPAQEEGATRKKSSRKRGAE